MFTFYKRNDRVKVAHFAVCVGVCAHAPVLCNNFIHVPSHSEYCVDASACIEASKCISGMFAVACTALIVLLIQNEHDSQFLTFKHVHSHLILCSFSWITLQIEPKSHGIASIHPKDMQMQCAQCTLSIPAHKHWIRILDYADSGARFIHKNKSFYQLCIITFGFDVCGNGNTKMENHLG